MDPQTNININATGNEDRFKVTNNYYNTYVDENPQVLEWLSPLEPRVRHHDVRTSRLDGVGEWLLQRDEFVNWRDGKIESDGAPLFCSGAPGVGKTYLSSLVIDTLCDQSVGQKVAVACFYCDFQSQKTQTPENILGALAKQLIRGFGGIPTEIDDAFQKSKRQVGGRSLRVPELLPLIEAALAPLEQAFICIDALDECLGKHLPELLSSLCTISQRSPKIRLFVTGRPHIHREIEKHFPGGAQFVEIKPKIEDIMKYLQMMLDKDPEPDAMNAELKAEILKRVSETISDVFLLVSLNIAAVLAEVSICDRREQLERMTSGLGLGDAYRKAFERMKAQGGAKSRLGMAALMWISRSERPMTADELCHALGVKIGSTDLNPDSAPSIQTLLASCHGLVTIDKMRSTVRLVHFTLQEYLDSHSEIFRSPYAAMAEVCLTYLNYDYVKKLLPTLDSAPPTVPFLEYASMHWGPYARNETTEEVKSLALRLLINFASHISAKFLLCEQLRFEWASLPEGFSGPHCVAYLGLDEIASALLQVNDGDINRKDFLGRTPLILAAQHGREGIARLLLKHKDVNYETKDARRGQTPLSWAAYGRCEVVKLLLDQEETDVESRDICGMTPLSHAARSGDEGVVKMFLERQGVDAESRDNDGRTPLSHAAQYGNERTVKLFLGREGVSAESRSNCGRTPLSYAAQSRNVEIVKLLIESGDPESHDNRSRTPLSYAVEWGNAEIVTLLLEREINAKSRDSAGRTPLSYAAQRGDAETVTLLLGRGGVDAESGDNDGRTPLSYAAGSGNKGVVELFLERKGVDAESQDTQGRTPFSYAAGGGDEGVVELFLKREGVNPDSPDIYGRTPLSYAAAMGWCEEVVKLLLERGEVDAESRDSWGRTPFSYAAQRGGWGMVELFLEREGVDTKSQDNGGRTPFSYAAEGGNTGVVELFLERQEIDAELQDYGGRTPFSYAAVSGDEEVMELLLEREGVNPDLPDIYGRTPLSYAAECCNEGAVKLLLEQEEVEPDSRDTHGRTPLSHAARYGNERTVMLLINNDKVDSESRDSRGRTPLSYAAQGLSWTQGRNERMVKLFLDREGVNAELRDDHGRTPLSHAAESGDAGVVKMFLDREEVNAESQDNDGRTLLSYAAGSGRVGVVKMFLDREEVNAESQDCRGKTPLSYADGWGRVEILKLLQERKGVNAESQDNQGRTPPFYSAKNGSQEMLSEQRVVQPRPGALLQDEVAQLPPECLDTMPVIQHGNARTPNLCTDNDDREAESLVQCPLQPQGVNSSSPQKSTQLCSLATPLIDCPYQNSGTSTQDSKLGPLTTPLVQPVPVIVSLEALPQLPRRRSPFWRGMSRRFVFQSLGRKLS